MTIPATIRMIAATIGQCAPPDMSEGIESCIFSAAKIARKIVTQRTISDPRSFTVPPLFRVRVAIARRVSDAAHP
jgi:hypothetical protein